MREPVKVLKSLSEQATNNINSKDYIGIYTTQSFTSFTPHEYLVRTRIDMAKYLLKNTQMHVKDICFATGFSCESVFCSAFKKNSSLSPNSYRKSN